MMHRSVVTTRSWLDVTGSRILVAVGTLVAWPSVISMVAQSLLSLGCHRPVNAVWAHVSIWT
jgi:hypothetical protein